jgi:sulfate transport system ATP-binding protein
MSLDIQSINKAFGRFPALDTVSLKVVDGEFLALLGPSGSGKTTLLRILAGLEKPDTGKVLFQGENFLAQSARDRRVGMVFQHYALFRHMTVAQNIAFGLKVRPRATRPSKAEIAGRVTELLRLVQLEGLEKRFPAQLSGGQRQRVALARALAIEPQVLLLDEPFGALDAKVRRELRKWLRHIHDATGVTTIFVTHDQEEALDLADRVAILKDGKLVQVGAPQEVYDRPADPFVYDFLGAAVSVRGQIRGDRIVVGDWETASPSEALALGPVDVFFRPNEVSLQSADGQGIAALVKGVARRGPNVQLECEVGGEVLDFELPGDTDISGLTPDVRVRLLPRKVAAFPRTPEAGGARPAAPPAAGAVAAVR